MSTHARRRLKRRYANVNWRRRSARAAGMRFLRQYAGSRGKLLSIPEWGTNIKVIHEGPESSYSWNPDGSTDVTRVYGDVIETEHTDPGVFPEALSAFRRQASGRYGRNR